MTSALNASEVKALQVKAGALGISIVAEIDLPGHSSALIKRIPSLAAHNAKTGAPCVEINISSPAVMQTLQMLLSEVMDIFPSPWHHLGADEVEYEGIPLFVRCGCEHCAPAHPCAT
jgi:hexosaminidase